MSEATINPMEHPKQFIIKGGRIMKGGSKVPSLKFVQIPGLGGFAYVAKLHQIPFVANSEMDQIKDSQDMDGVH